MQLYPGRRYFRAKAPLQILKGYYPTEPVVRSHVATPKLDEGIKEGMAIVLDNNGEWVKARTADITSLTKSVYIARQDQDNHAVQASGKLTGLDCSGQFEFQSGYMVQSGTYPVDTELAVADGGLLKAASVGDKVVGKVSLAGSAQYSLIELGGLVPSASDMKVLQWKTIGTHYLKA